MKTRKKKSTSGLANKAKPYEYVEQRAYCLLADVSPAKKSAIEKYCGQNNLTVSDFLTQLAVEDARKHSKGQPEQRTITVTLTFAADEEAKLQIFAKRQKKTLETLIQETLAPKLKKQKTRFSAKAEPMRYYLTRAEHQMVRESLEGRRLSSRSYVGFLAEQAIEKLNELPFHPKYPFPAV